MNDYEGSKFSKKIENLHKQKHGNANVTTADRLKSVIKPSPIKHHSKSVMKEVKSKILDDRAAIDIDEESKHEFSHYSSSLSSVGAYESDHDDPGEDKESYAPSPPGKSRSKNITLIPKYSSKSKRKSPGHKK